MGRLVVIATGLLLGFLGGCCFLVTALLVESLSVPAEAGRALFDVAALLLSGLQTGNAGLMVHTAARAIWLGLVTVCLAPLAVAALVGEALRLRSAVWVAGVTGALAASSPSLLAAAQGSGASGTAPGTERTAVILFLTGVTAGLVYWLVAGRRTGQA